MLKKNIMHASELPDFRSAKEMKRMPIAAMACSHGTVAK